MCIRDSNKAVTEAFWKSVNERDWSSFLEYLTPDCEYVYAKAKGKEAVLQRFNQGGGVEMDFYQKVERITAEGDVVMIVVWVAGGLKVGLRFRCV